MLFSIFDVEYIVGQTDQGTCGILSLFRYYLASLPLDLWQTLVGLVSAIQANLSDSHSGIDLEWI